jgi:hypothetical protein
MGMTLKGLWLGHWRDGRKDGGWASQSKGQPFLCDFVFLFFRFLLLQCLSFLFFFQIFMSFSFLSQFLMHHLPADLSLDRAFLRTLSSFSTASSARRMSQTQCRSFFHIPSLIWTSTRRSSATQMAFIFFSLSYLSSLVFAFFGARGLRAEQTNDRGSDPDSHESSALRKQRHGQGH